MGFQLPAGVVNTGSAYYYANATNTYGPLTMQPSDGILVFMDYSKATPVPPHITFAFTFDVGSNPPLIVAYPEFDAAGAVLSFMLAGGVAGQQYNLAIEVDGGARTDTLSINIPSSGECGCGGPLSIPLPNGNSSLPPANPFINTAPRFFWGPVAPNAPNLMDEWLNTSTGYLYTWVSNGLRYYWQLDGLPLAPTVPFAEQLIISTANVIPALSYTPVDAMTTMQVILNGSVFVGCENPSSFSVAGNRMTWRSLIYSVLPGDKFIASYHY